MENQYIAVRFLGVYDHTLNEARGDVVGVGLDVDDAWRQLNDRDRAFDGNHCTYDDWKAV